MEVHRGRDQPHEEGTGQVLGAALRSADMFSTNPTPKGNSNADGWGFRSGLVYGSIFDCDEPFSVTIGIYLRMEPVTAVVDGERVFSRTHPDSATYSSGNFEYTTDNRSKTTEVASVQGFIHGTVPWIGLTTGFLVDDKGIRKAKGNINVQRTDLWESLGPQFAAIRQLGSYQLGLQALAFETHHLQDLSSADFSTILGRTSDVVSTTHSHRSSQKPCNISARGGSSSREKRGLSIRVLWTMSLEEAANH